MYIKPEISIEIINQYTAKYVKETNGGISQGVDQRIKSINSWFQLGSSTLLGKSKLLGSSNIDTIFVEITTDTVACIGPSSRSPSSCQDARVARNRSTSISTPIHVNRAFCARYPREVMIRRTKVLWSVCVGSVLLAMKKAKSLPTTLRMILLCCMVLQNIIYIGWW